jgi:hypothetical protein
MASMHDGPEQVPSATHATTVHASIAFLCPCWHGDRPHTAVLTDQIDDAPAGVALLNVLHRPVCQLRPAEPASQQRSEHGPVSQPLLRPHVRCVKERLRLAERKPVANTDALDSRDPRRQQPVVRRLDCQLSDSGDSDININRDRAKSAGLKRNALTVNSVSPEPIPRFCGGMVLFFSKSSLKFIRWA